MVSVAGSRGAVVESEGSSRPVVSIAGRAMYVWPVMLALSMRLSKQAGIRRHPLLHTAWE